MANEIDPLEGFQLVAFDASTKEATIAVSSLLLVREDQIDALAKKAAAIILRDEGKTIHSVKFVERSIE